MISSHASTPGKLGRDFYLRLIGVAVATWAVVIALSALMRWVEHPLPPWMVPTLFLTAVPLVQPKLRGTQGRSLRYRLVFSLVNGVIGGACLWALFTWI